VTPPSCAAIVTAAGTSVRMGREKKEYRCLDGVPVLARRTRSMFAAAGYAVENVDCVVALEAPKILPHIPDIRRALAEDMEIAVDRVSVKGKTAEGLGAVGAGQAVGAGAVALLRERGA
jgi:2-C-methyl-D-erythritol 2,4-cyclodiphosphate synthase